MSGTYEGVARRRPRYERLESGEPRAVADTGRECQRAGCSTKLSRYNPNPYCTVHGGWSDPEEGKAPGSSRASAPGPPGIRKDTNGSAKAGIRPSSRNPGAGNPDDGGNNGSPRGANQHSTDRRATSNGQARKLQPGPDDANTKRTATPEQRRKGSRPAKTNSSAEVDRHDATTDSSGNGHMGVMAELHWQPSGNWTAEEAQERADALLEALSEPGLQLSVGGSCAFIHGHLDQVLHAVRQAHRVLQKQDSRVVTNLRIESGQDGQAMQHRIRRADSLASAMRSRIRPNA